LGHHGNAQQDLANLANVWTPGQDMSNPDSWTTPILAALTGECTHALLLAEYECTEWGPTAGPASSDAPVAMAGPAGTQNLNADGTGHSNPPSALLSLVLSPLSMLFVSSHEEGHHHSNLEAQQQAGDCPPANQSQRIPHAILKTYQYVFGDVTLAQSEEYLKLQSVQRIPAVPKDERDTIFHECFPQTDTVDPTAPLANPAAPAEKKNAWNLNWGPLSWMADMSAWRPVTGPVDELLLQIHGRAYPDASGACCGSDDVLVQEIFF